MPKPTWKRQSVVESPPPNQRQKMRNQTCLLWFFFSLTPPVQLHSHLSPSISYSLSLSLSLSLFLLFFVNGQATCFSGNQRDHPWVSRRFSKAWFLLISILITGLLICSRDHFEHSCSFCSTSLSGSTPQTSSSLCHNALLPLQSSLSYSLFILGDITYCNSLPLPFSVACGLPNLLFFIVSLPLSVHLLSCCLILAPFFLFPPHILQFSLSFQTPCFPSFAIIFYSVRFTTGFTCVSPLLSRAYSCLSSLLYLFFSVHCFLSPFSNSPLPFSTPPWHPFDLTICRCEFWGTRPALPLTDILMACIVMVQGGIYQKAPIITIVNLNYSFSSVFVALVIFIKPLAQWAWRQEDVE